MISQRIKDALILRYLLRFFVWYPGLLPGIGAVWTCYMLYTPTYPFFFDTYFQGYVIAVWISLLAAILYVVYFWQKDLERASLVRGLISTWLVMAYFLIPCLSFLSTFRELPDTQTARYWIDATVSNRRLTQNYNKLMWDIQWQVHSVVDNTGISLPCFTRTTLSFRCAPPCLVQIGKRYRVQGTLFIIQPDVINHRTSTLYPTVRFTPNWKSLEYISCSPLAYHIGEKRIYIHRYIELAITRLYPKDGRVREAILSMTFGLPLSKESRSAIHRVGIDHIFAISGFHFSYIVALVVALFVRSNEYMRAIAILCTVTLFLIVIGPGSASVVRAWCTICIMCSAPLVSRQASSYNSLGIALVSTLLYNPIFVHTVGFQLSFLATAAILFLANPISYFFKKYLFIQREQERIKKLSPMDRLFYFVNLTFSPIIAVTCSVWIFILPYALICFDNFSLLGLVYNIFTPALFSCAFIGAFLSLGLYTVSAPLASYIAWGVEKLMLFAFLLIDSTWDVAWNMPSFIYSIFTSQIVIVLWYILIIGGSICVHVYQKDKRPPRFYNL